MARGRDKADRLGDTSGEFGDSPWAGDVPITPAPVEFGWATTDADDVTTDVPPPAASGRSPVADDTPVDVDRRRPTLIALGVLAAMAAIVGALTLVGGGDDATDVADSVVPPTDPVADSLPPISSEPSPNDDDADNTSTTTERTREDGEDGEDGESVGERSTSNVSARAWSSTTIEVPNALRDLEPTVLVVVTATQAYHEIELPSGRVRSIGVDRVFLEGQLAVGASTSMLAGFAVSRPNSVLLRPGEVPIDVELPADRSNVTTIPSTDDYVTLSYDGEATSVSEIRVAADGSTTTEQIALGPVVPWLRSYSPEGGKLVTDAGGVYEERDGETVRISPGLLIAASSHHLLVRECDEAYNCEFALIDGRTAERRVVQVDESLSPQLAGQTIQVSPDGRYLRYMSFRSSTADEVLLDLSTGESTDLATDGTFDVGQPVWAAGSEGVFRRAANVPGLELVDRETGVATAFAGELGSVRQFGVRLGIDLPEPVAASPLATRINVIGLSLSGEIIEVDVDAGVVLTTEAPPLASGAPARIFPDADGALIVSYDNVPSIRFDAAERTAVLTRTSQPGGPLFDGPVVGSVWESRNSADPNGPGMVLVDALARELGPRLVSADRSSTIAGDGAGNLLIDVALDGVFVAGVDLPPQRLTRGEVLAINAGVAFVRECDDALQCSVARVVRGSGERQPLAGTPLDRATGMPPGIVWAGSSVSPDGEVVVAFSNEGASSSGQAFVADLTAGSAVAVPPLSVSTPIIWSDDSQFAVFLADSELFIYDRAGRRVQVSSSIPQLKVIAAVPADVADIAPPVLEIQPDLSTGIDELDAETGVIPAPPSDPTESATAAPDDDVEIVGPDDVRALVIGPAPFPY